MRKYTHSNGQSTAEAAISLLFFSVFIATIIQLLWLLLAQQMLQATTLSAARYAAKSSANQSGMLLLIQNRFRKIPGIDLHIPEITRIRPTDEDIRKYGRVEQPSNRYRLSSEFPDLELSLLTPEEQELFLKARILQLEITYCFSLRIPLAGAIISQAAKFSKNNLYCSIQERNRATLPISTGATVPLENDFWL